MLMSISPPYPEVTLDNFSFPVDSHLAARLVVLWPKSPLTKSKGFLAEINFFLKPILKSNPFLWKTMVRVIFLHFYAFFVHFDKLI